MAPEAVGVAALGICDLPDEVLVEIFSYLPPEDLARCAHACGTWCALLRRERGLWRRKEWSSGSAGATRLLLAGGGGGGVPRLRDLQLLYGSRYGIRLAWPEVTVQLYVGTPSLWDPYVRALDTETLVVSRRVAENISGYVECADARTLRRICVAEQRPEYGRPLHASFSTFVPTGLRYSCRLRRYICTTMVHSAEECYRRDGPVPDVESGSRTSSVADVSEREETDGDEPAACPSLEVLNVHCEKLSQQRLAELCGLGPLRVLRVESRGLRDLSLLRGLRPHLEELAVADCAALDAREFCELRELVRLRALRLGRCRLPEASLRDLAAALPNLRSLSLDGRELLGSGHSLP